MTELVVPPPDTEGYWHYTYITYHPDTFEWYGGKHSTTNLQDGYTGSGYWVRQHSARNELITEIVEFFLTESEAFAAEAAMVTTAIIETDSLCRNQCEGGQGITQAAMKRLLADTEWRANKAATNARIAKDPEWKRRHREAVQRLAADPDWQAKNKAIRDRIHTDPEWKRRHDEAMAKLHAEADYRKNRQQGWDAWWANTESRQAHLKTLKRNRSSDEWRRSNAAKNAEQAKNPKWLSKMRDILTERNKRQATDPKWLAMVAVRNADPEYRRRYLEGIARRTARYHERKLAAG